MILHLQFDSDIPIYVQLRNEIVKGIGNGSLAYGESLPTVRQLAADVGVNAMTVNKAYNLLKQEGFISIDRRHGATVNPIFHNHADFREKLESELQLLSSEAAIQGMDKDDFLEMCTRVYCMVNIKR